MLDHSCILLTCHAVALAFLSLWIAGSCSRAPAITTERHEAPLKPLSLPALSPIPLFPLLRSQLLGGLGAGHKERDDSR